MADTKGKKQKLPKLLNETGLIPADGTKADDYDPKVWIEYLQQMLNYHYQLQVVPESGEFCSTTANAVEHFRDQQGLTPPGSSVDVETWKLLGVDDQPAAETKDKPKKDGAEGTEKAEGAEGEAAAAETSAETSAETATDEAGTFEESDHSVSAVDKDSDETSWAAAMATVLNYKGQDYTVDSLCSAAHTEKARKSWQEVETMASNLGMHTAKCNAGSQAAWAGVLQHNGPLLAAVPGQEYSMIVVAGIRQNGDIHVVDPSSGYDDWLDFSTFTTHYGMGDGQAELLAVS